MAHASEAAQTNGRTALPRELRLALAVRDPEVILEICKYPEGPSRDGFALLALRLGVLALRQASGAIDSATLREEGERLLGSVRELLTATATRTLSELSGSLRQYFDPTSGDLPQRLERLIRKDGDLEAVLQRHLEGDTSTLARTLAKHVGEQSDPEDPGQVGAHTGGYREADRASASASHRPETGG